MYASERSQRGWECRKRKIFRQINKQLLQVSHQSVHAVTEWDLYSIGELVFEVQMSKLLQWYPLGRLMLSCSSLLSSSSHGLAVPCLPAKKRAQPLPGRLEDPTAHCEPNSRTVGALGPRRALWKIGIITEVVHSPQA